MQATLNFVFFNLIFLQALKICKAFLATHICLLFFFLFQAQPAPPSRFTLVLRSSSKEADFRANQRRDWRKNRGNADRAASSNSFLFCAGTVRNVFKIQNCLGNFSKSCSHQVSNGDRIAADDSAQVFDNLINLKKMHFDFVWFYKIVIFLYCNNIIQWSMYVTSTTRKKERSTRK